MYSADDPIVTLLLFLHSGMLLDDYLIEEILERWCEYFPLGAFKPFIAVSVSCLGA